MDKHDYTQDTINVKQFLDKSQEGSDYSASENTQPDELFPLTAQPVASNVTGEDQHTKTLPINYAAGSHLPSYKSKSDNPDQQDILTPEALDEENPIDQDLNDDEKKKKIFTVLVILAGVFYFLLFFNCSI